MCQIHVEGASQEAPRVPVPDGPPFPWAIGAYDAHCHPTDTMASLDEIPEMKAAALTVMATRSQDQALVADVASSPLCITSQAGLGEGRVVPAFGWHPWFSHQFYDDTLPQAEQTYSPSSSGDGAKVAHYRAVLQPPPAADDKVFFDSLPEPRPLSGFIEETKQRLIAHPTALVGEIGLDKIFRLPRAFDEDTDAPREEGLTPGGRDGRLLSPHRVSMAHQAAVLKAQLALAGELGRAVSVHGVQAHGWLYDMLAATWKGHEKEVLSRRERNRIAPGAEDFSSSDEDGDEDDAAPAEKKAAAAREKKSSKAAGPKPFPPRICLHSFSAPDEMMRQYLDPAIPARIFFSYSAAINLAKSGEDKFVAQMKVCPDDRVLVESDLHVAGGKMDEALEMMYRKVCEAKGWELEEGVRRIRRNYEEFIFG